MGSGRPRAARGPVPGPPPLGALYTSIECRVPATPPRDRATPHATPADMDLCGNNWTRVVPDSRVLADRPGRGGSAAAHGATGHSVEHVSGRSWLAISRIDSLGLLCACLYI